ncbi:di-trans,poly-cis-decaprenylcistransferase [Candidatus Uhrbacteria bacterium CG_4_9_14_3_um_filter_36_7]|uniref:Isoprenyl transferase n=1 Tax=Candidatus Uhrbacteria bacterium CG_4_9_14_3_um_filter_36_7 TaxID=1975033 RepID=A0A2M7XHI8_9BACT|nr:MAG: di-trans,poly-cis-decaprenylcistransferase [Candidatus Uhrbacteria bacterium CG_4_9_14_3_um_filter_36_7]
MENSIQEKQLVIHISGRVQAVFVRHNIKRIAEQYTLTGFTQNLPDGRIEVVAEGEEICLRHLLDWCYRGSFLARVDSLSFTWKPASRVFKNFSISTRGQSIIKDEHQALKHLSRRVVRRVINKVPQHLLIIPDGNRRWAKDRGMLVWQGHEVGAHNTIKLAEEAKKLGISFFTIWGFSTENWNRNIIEVKQLMFLFEKILEEYKSWFIDHKIQFHHFGRKDRLPKSLLESILHLEQKTKLFTKYHFAIALDYGGRDELLRAVEQIKGLTNIEEDDISKALDSYGFPDPDFIVRTSGEQRTSGIMPWQSVYAELYFSPLYFPDFSPAELRFAVQDYEFRQRRMGH